MADETQDRRLSDILRFALTLAKKTGRSNFDEQIRSLYEAVLEDEKRYEANRRATDGADAA